MANAAKAVPYTTLVENSGAGVADIFTQLVSMRVHQAASVYSEEVAKHIRAAAADVAAQDQELARTLEASNLPDALFAHRQLPLSRPSHALELPVDLVSAWTSVRDGGGMETIERLVASVNCLLHE